MPQTGSLVWAFSAAFSAPCGAASACFIRDSESSRKFPEVTMRSPASRPARICTRPSKLRPVSTCRGSKIPSPRQVETGRSFDGRVQILAGLEAGERIVTSGNFLLDSESRMKQAEAAPHGAEKAAEKAQTKDPVCGMDLAGPTQFQGESADQHFFFCSSECKHKFEKEPGLYLHKATGGRRHGGPQS